MLVLYFLIFKRETVISLLEGDINLQVNKILLYHGNKPLRAFREYKESGFQTTVEMLLSTNLYISEMRLIVDYTKKSAPKYGFVDLMLLEESSFLYSAIIELKLFNLVGLYCGKKGEWIKNPEFKDLYKLNEELKTEAEDELINRNYMHWSKDDNCYKIITAKKYIDEGVKQLKKYIFVISKGNAQIKEKSVGILDSRISIESGLSYTRGILIASFGSQRVLTREINLKKIYRKFVINDK